jgi:hypothetical protein
LATLFRFGAKLVCGAHGGDNSRRAASVGGLVIQSKGSNAICAGRNPQPAEALKPNNCYRRFDLRLARQ